MLHIRYGFDMEEVGEDFILKSQRKGNTSHHRSHLVKLVCKNIVLRVHCLHEIGHISEDEGCEHVPTDNHKSRINSLASIYRADIISANGKNAVVEHYTILGPNPISIVSSMTRI